jgi:hypothetical protein
MSQLGFEIKSTEKCINYIKSFGIAIKNYYHSLSIPSEYGLLYKLPNNKIVLILSCFSNKEYPGFIYNNIDNFKEMVGKDYFPIEPPYTTVWGLEKCFEIISLNKNGEKFNGYYGLSFIRKCGELQFNKSTIIENSNNNSEDNTKYYKGLVLDMKSWEGLIVLFLKELYTKLFLKSETALIRK